MVVASFVVIANPSRADDQPNHPGTWAGLHAGFHAGVVRTQADFSNGAIFDPGSNFNFGRIDLAASGRSFAGGAQVGWNWQFGKFVVGIEADGSLGNFRTTADAPVQRDLGSRPVLMRTVPAEIDWMASLRGRAGIGSDRMLVFATGGVAYAATRANMRVFSPLFGIETRMHTGWTAGAGAGVTLDKLWSLTAEYRHFDFGRQAYSFGFLPIRGSFTVDQFTMRLNRRLLGP